MSVIMTNVINVLYHWTAWIMRYECLGEISEKG